jgi:uracil-DNA glycosylase family 4
MNANHLSENDRAIRTSPLSMEDHTASVLLIFQAPGIEEWKSGKPISSLDSKSAGARLASAFHLAGKDRNDYNITNTVQCFPGKRGHCSISKPRDKTPPAKVRQHCNEWLRQDIEMYQYKRVVVFGALARKAVWELGYKNDPRFHFIKHPTGGISVVHISQVLV